MHLNTSDEEHVNERMLSNTMHCLSDFTIVEQTVKTQYMPLSSINAYKIAIHCEYTQTHKHDHLNELCATHATTNASVDLPLFYEAYKACKRTR